MWPHRPTEKCAPNAHSAGRCSDRHQTMCELSTSALPAPRRQTPRCSARTTTVLMARCLNSRCPPGIFLGLLDRHVCSHRLLSLGRSRISPRHHLGASCGTGVSHWVGLATFTSPAPPRGLTWLLPSSHHLSLWVDRGSLSPAPPRGFLAALLPDLSRSVRGRVTLGFPRTNCAVAVHCHLFSRVLSSPV